MTLFWEQRVERTNSRLEGVRAGSESFPRSLGSLGHSYAPSSIVKAWGGRPLMSFGEGSSCLWMSFMSIRPVHRPRQRPGHLPSLPCSWHRQRSVRQADLLCTGRAEEFVVGTGPRTGVGQPGEERPEESAGKLLASCRRGRREGRGPAQQPPRGPRRSSGGGLAGTLSGARRQEGTLGGK